MTYAQQEIIGSLVGIVAQTRAGRDVLLTTRSMGTICVRPDGSVIEVELSRLAANLGVLDSLNYGSRAA